MNKRFLIIKDKEYRHKRVLVEQKVTDSKPLLPLQNEISKVNSNFQPEPAEKLHMTVAHFGIPEELYNEFREVNEGLTFNKFLEHFYKLIQKCSEELPSDMGLKAEGLDIFGTPPHNVAVLKFVKTFETRQSREAINLAIKNFVTDFGVDDADKFISQSTNLKYNPEGAYSPHVTLGYVGENTALPKTDVSDMKISLSSAKFRGVQLLSD